MNALTSTTSSDFNAPGSRGAIQGKSVAKDSVIELPENNSELADFEAALVNADKASSQIPINPISIQEIVASKQLSERDLDTSAEEANSPFEMQGILLGGGFERSPALFQEEGTFKIEGATPKATLLGEKTQFGFSQIDGASNEIPALQRSSIGKIQSLAAKNALGKEIAALENKHELKVDQQSRVQNSEGDYHVRDFTKTQVERNTEQGLEQGILAKKAFTDLGSLRGDLETGALRFGKEEGRFFRSGGEQPLAPGAIAFGEAVANATKREESFAGIESAPLNEDENTRPLHTLPRGTLDKNSQMASAAAFFQKKISSAYQKNLETNRTRAIEGTNNLEGSNEVFSGESVTKLNSPFSSPNVSESIVPHRTTSNHLVNDITGNVSIMLSKKKNEMTMKMNPEHLGKLEFRLIQDKGKLSAFITVENPEAKTILENQIKQLKESLEEQGIQIQEMNIDLKGEDSKGGAFAFGDHQEKNQEARARQDWRKEQQELREQKPVSNISQVHSSVTESGINIYA